MDLELRKDLATGRKMRGGWGGDELRITRMGGESDAGRRVMWRGWKLEPISDLDLLIRVI